MREYLDGATAIVRGALDAGCDFFAGYPISPATGILLQMVRDLPACGGTAIQAEDEIASLSMCIGAAMTGRRVLTATSGPGLSLYSENIGLALMGEVPLVIVDVQRMGPATGGATTVAQGDVQFARWGNSGGYPIIALTPAGLADAYNLTRRAFDFSERFRVPVFLLTDKELVMAMGTVEADEFMPLPVRPRRPASPLAPGTEGLRAEEGFLPWRFEPIDAPPPFSPYGGEHIMRFTGSSHDEHGMLTKDPAAVGRLNDHLSRKIEDHRAEIELAVPDLDPEASTLWVAYGITARAMQAAAIDVRRSRGHVSTLTLQTLWPVPETALLQAAFGVREIVVAELNMGQYRREVERVVYRHAALERLPAPLVRGLTRVDGKLITPEQFAETLCTQK